MNIFKKLFGKNEENDSQPKNVNPEVTSNVHENTPAQENQAEETKVEETKAEEKIEQPVATTVETKPLENATAEAKPQPQPQQPQFHMPEDFIKMEDVADIDIDTMDHKFTMVILKTLPLQDDEVEVNGNVHGKIEINDEVYICCPSGVMKAKVVHIEDNSQISAQHLEDKAARIVIKGIKNKQLVAPLMVVTNVPPMKIIKSPNDVENPFLKGLIRDVPFLNQDPNYMNIVSFMLCHNIYVAPVIVRDEEGKVLTQEIVNEAHGIKGGWTLDVKWLISDDAMMFPLFTDHRSYNTYIEKMKESAGANTEIEANVMLPMSFQDALAMTQHIQTNIAQETENKIPEEYKQKIQNAGMVINAYDNPNLNLDKNFINNLITSEGYQQEFNQKK